MTEEEILSEDEDPTYLAAKAALAAAKRSMALAKHVAAQAKYRRTHKEQLNAAARRRRLLKKLCK